MSTTDFTPERSAAIRQLLIDTVADESRRRKRIQILLTSVLSAIAIVLAGGTAALALTGVIHLGGDDTPPAPVPTPTQTVTPTPTPTPTATPTPTPLVQSAPVLPHDVDTLRDTTRWSLDLPGDPDCTSASSYTLSDARVVYVSGLRPKEYEGSNCVNHTGEDFGVTLVDTSTGTVLWQREWKFTPKDVAFGAGFEVLGTSGRAVFASREAGIGPHDVLDLATGETVGTFEPDWADFWPNRDMRAVPGDSGDIITVRHLRDANGRAISDDILTRADPADLAHPVWSRPVGLRESYLGVMVPDGTAMTIDGFEPQSNSNRMAMMDLQTGSSTPVTATYIQSMSQIVLGQNGGRAGSPGELIAYGADGLQLWSRPLPHETTVFQAATPGTLPTIVNGYQTADTGELFLDDGSTLALIDQTTGTERWAIPKPSCFADEYQPFRAVLDVRRDIFLLASADSTCAVSHQSGDAVDAPSIPRTGAFYQVFGITHRYEYEGQAEAGRAYDLATGELLWTRQRHDYEGYSFDGGYLVSRHLNHVESIG